MVPTVATASKRCKTQEDKIGWGAIAAGAGALVMTSALAPYVAAGFLLNAGVKLLNRKTAHL